MTSSKSQNDTWSNKTFPNLFDVSVELCTGREVGHTVKVTKTPDIINVNWTITSGVFITSDVFITSGVITTSGVIIISNVRFTAN